MHRSNKSNDYKFFDKRISELYTVGGTIVYAHLYMGPADTGASTDPSQPQYENAAVTNIQDLLFLENRDRKYSDDVYQMRGYYQRQDINFDLAQFGLFLADGTIFMSFHLNDMVDTIGRKLMPGDVIEVEHLKDFHTLDETIPVALQRFFVVTDATWPAEGFSLTWYPHTWRCKLQPLVDSQEYKDILSKIKVGTEETPLTKIISNYDKLMEINDAIINAAEVDVNKSGYNTEHLYTKPTVKDSEFGRSPNIATDRGENDGPGPNPADQELYTPKRSAYEDYLTGDGLAPNGHPVTSGTRFPPSNTVEVGHYHLRLDFIPQRLFRWDGKRWSKVEDVQRTSLGRGKDNVNQRSGFVNNEKTYKDINRNTLPERQALSDALRPKPD